MATLVVNWDDTNAQDVILDPVSLGWAAQKSDKCTRKNLWTGEITAHLAVP